jgi:hypothetical protein
MAGERLIRPETAGGLDGGAADPRLEVGERPDARAPPVSDRPQKKKGGGVLGRRGCEAGPAWADGARAGKKKKAAGLGWMRAERNAGPAGKEKRGRGREKDFSLFFKFLFKFIFQTFKLQSNRNPCI